MQQGFHSMVSKNKGWRVAVRHIGAFGATSLETGI
eukprot:jgi/Antlo1/1603/465